jgi:maltose alpha-D-glucosyltransferase/alpha-amylase
MPDAPTFRTEGNLSTQTLEALLPAIVAHALPSFIGAQRWFGDKSRDIARIEGAARLVLPQNGSFLILLGVRLFFDTGGPVEYFVPLSVARSAAGDVAPVARIEAVDGEWTVLDAVQTPAFRRWLLEELARDRRDSSSGFRWSASSAANEFLSAAMLAESRVSSAQQSNSSIVYGSSVILKVFRRLSPGLNPEVELGRFFTTRTGFRNTPRLLGEWSYEGPDGVTRSLAVAQSFIPSVGDGWSYTLETLYYATTATDADARRLGQLTAQMHLALESARGDPDLAPEPIGAKDIAAWSQRVARAVESTAGAVATVAGREHGETRELIDAFLNLAPRLASQASGFDRLIGRNKTRVHGDYHLGQTLRTTDGDFVILDFEGEPQRPIEERRAKTSPLKDVAGMLRSFGYARGAAERRASTGDAAREDLRSMLVAWERSTRRAFIDSYVAESRRGGARYLPASDDDVRQALSAWELDKALYEVNYELNNRPDWLALPLAATLKLA